MDQEVKTISFNSKEFNTLSEILLFYKEFQEDLYDYPDPKSLFTETMIKLFDMFEVEIK